MYALIQAGGQGTRLKEITGDVLPKPMVRVNGKPLLHYQIDNLRESGILDIIVVTSPAGDEIVRSYFGDGSSFGVHISYILEQQPLGTGGALYYLKDRPDENFALLFGDLMLSVDWQRFLNYHLSKEAEITAFAHPNSHPFDSDLLVADSNGRVLSIDSKHNVRNYY